MVSACALRMIALAKMALLCDIAAAHRFQSVWQSSAAPDCAPARGESDCAEVVDVSCTCAPAAAMSLSSAASTPSTRWLSVGSPALIDCAYCCSCAEGSADWAVAGGRERPEPAPPDNEAERGRSAAEIDAAAAPVLGLTAAAAAL